MHSHVHVHRPTRATGFGEAIRLLPLDPAPLRIHRETEVSVDTGSGHLVRWHLSGGPWSASPSAAIGPLKGFHHAILAPGATWPTHVHEDLQAVTYMVTGVLEHSDSLGNHGVLTTGEVHQRWLGWGTEHQEWNPSQTDRAEFVTLWLAVGPSDPTCPAQQSHLAAEQHSRGWLQVALWECWPSHGLTPARDARMHVARIDASSGPIRYGFEPGQGGYVYVVEGDVEMNLERLQTGDAARVLSGGRLRIRAFDATELILVEVPL
jgi:hypothetical protein